MREIIFATGNQGKLHYVRTILAAYQFNVVQTRVAISEPRSEDVRIIASEKASAAFRALGRSCIVLDSGFHIHSLKGFPGTYVNYVLKTIGIRGILQLLGAGKRECEFRNCLAYVGHDFRKPVLFESIVRGSLARVPAGGMKDRFWSDLYRVFIPAGRRKTLAEMTDAEYWTWNDIANSDSFVHKFAAWLTK
ncbi:MAG: hypothetical protein NTZ78_01210 [Candidatus Aureabacteria bacterium]|nr:hypothetical protein [Candidatus Auribacterota bacterium]